MRVVEISFSPTGGTKKVADGLCKHLNDSFEVVDLSDSVCDFANVSFASEDIAVIAVPSYGGRVPEAVIPHISQIHGNGCKAIIIGVYGNRAYEDTLVELYDLAQAGGFEIIAAVAAVAEHSIARQYAVGRPDIADQKELSIFAEKILDKLHAQTYDTLNLPGNRPYKKRGDGGLVPKASKDCTQCGLCAEKCPVQAIDKNSPRITDSQKCISCMRCVQICPQSARKVNQAVMFAVSAALKKECSKQKEYELYL